MCKKQGTFQGQLRGSVIGAGNMISGPDQSKPGRLIVLAFVESSPLLCSGVLNSMTITCAFKLSEYATLLDWLRANKPVNINGVLTGDTLDPAYWELA